MAGILDQEMETSKAERPNVPADSGASMTFTAEAKTFLESNPKIEALFELAANAISCKVFKGYDHSMHIDISFDHETGKGTLMIETVIKGSQTRVREARNRLYAFLKDGLPADLSQARKHFAFLVSSC